MRFTLNLFLCICAVLMLAACGVAERTVREPASKPAGDNYPHAGSSSPPAAMGVSRSPEVRASLEQAYRDWEGTPYDFGGNSSRGIDCSAFMQRIFKRYFGIKIPRSTRRQLHAGKGVRRRNLISGDLVFFKTGRKTLHVGVIMESNIFLHASTSRGVTTSSLDDYYWQSRYLAARRVMQLR